MNATASIRPYPDTALPLSDRVHGAVGLNLRMDLDDLMDSITDILEDEIFELTEAWRVL